MSSLGRFFIAASLVVLPGAPAGAAPERYRPPERREIERRDMEEANRRVEEIRTRAAKLDPRGEVNMRTERIKTFLDSHPEWTEARGFRQRIMEYAEATKGEDFSIERKEVWIREKFSEQLERNRFKGTLRELSHLELLEVSGYQVEWQPRMVEVPVSFGGASAIYERRFDIRATAKADQRVRVLEVKAAELSDRISSATIEIFREAYLADNPIPILSEALIARGARGGDPTRELLIDAIDGYRNKKNIEWVVDSAPVELARSLRRFNVDLCVYH